MFKQLLVILTGLLISVVSARQVDVSFEQWKARQEQYDVMLITGKRPEVYRQPIVQAQPLAEKSQRSVVPKSSQLLGESIRLNINTASKDEIIAKLDGVGQKKAQAIIEYRQQHGQFKQVDDLLNVKGIGIKTLDKNRERIRLKGG